MVVLEATREMSEQLVSFRNFEFGVRLSHHGFSQRQCGAGQEKKKAVTPNEKARRVSPPSTRTISDARLAPACCGTWEEEDRRRS